MNRNQERHRCGDQITSLLDTVDQLRRERFPHLNAELVESLLRRHADPSAAESELVRSVELLVEKSLTEEEDGLATH